jgi:YesN/AraC family two-component response regulator
MFENKFLAYVDDKNFIAVIERRHPLLPDVFDGNLAVISDKHVRKVLRYTRRAVLALSEALDDSAERFAHFKSGKTIEYPKGLANKMWNSLKATYDVKDTVTTRELKQRMREITMTKDDDPRKIANALHAIQQDSYDTDGPISDAEAISHFSAILPFFYTSILQVHEETMKKKGDTATVQSIGAAVHSMYRQSQMQ